MATGNNKRRGLTWLGRIFKKLLTRGQLREYLDYAEGAGSDSGVSSGFEQDGIPSELKKYYLFDFREDIYQPGGGPVMGNNNNNESIDNAPKEQTIEVRPIDVLEELERMPKRSDFLAIDGKIKMLEKKRDLIDQTYSKREVDALLMRLRNRRHYDQYREFFEGFDSTDEAMVETLVGKYNNLTMKRSDLFVPEFPDSAVETMEKYKERTEELCGFKPNFWVIANENDFQKKYERRDPILLAQSPFGFYYDILGAWGDEMVLLQEL